MLTIHILANTSSGTCLGEKAPPWALLFGCYHCPVCVLIFYSDSAFVGHREGIVCVCMCVCVYCADDGAFGDYVKCCFPGKLTRDALGLPEATVCVSRSPSLPFDGGLGT